MNKGIEIRSNISWKIFIPFIFLTFSGIGLFYFFYEMSITSEKKIENGAILFFGLFGLVGFHTFFVSILRAKKVLILEDNLTLKRVFTRQIFIYNSNKIICFWISSHSNRYSDYEILLFKTSDNLVHSIVSYEQSRYPEIKNWFHKAVPNEQKISLWYFFKNEYLIAFFLSSIILFFFLKDLIWLEY